MVSSRQWQVGKGRGAPRNGTFGLGCDAQVYCEDVEVKRRRGPPAGGKSRSKGTEAEKRGMYRANSLTRAERGGLWPNQPWSALEGAGEPARALSEPGFRANYGMEW